jgi:hypothetical protein
MATEDTLIDKEKLIREEQQLNAAVEDLRTKLNAVIAARQLKPMDVLILLSRISAGYIHQLEKAKPTNMPVDEIEERFHFMVESHLAEFDLNDIGQEMKRMNTEVN